MDIKGLYLSPAFVSALALAGCVTSPTLTFPSTTSTSSVAVVGQPSEQVVVASTSTTTTSTSTSTPAINLDPVALVRQQFDETLQWRIECGRKPRSCRVDDIAIVGSPYHAAMRDIMASRASQNIASKAGHGQYLVRVESVSIDESTMIATIETCVFDSIVLYMDGFIFNNHITSSHTRWTLQWNNSRWRWIAVETRDKPYNTDICGFGS